ncbi:MAG: Cof-type HAD-IIB family hydrolase [Oscillospiraceae bacterium]|nr:Cof-type HAD-IIB family hydrolase [Oscillospiraceae bacterium]
MVKLIVSDLDGTLLDDKKTLPVDLSTLLDELARKGILFSTGSGRNYATQKRLFKGFCDKLSFICDNGAYIVENGVNTFVSVIPEEEWRRLVVLLETCIPEALIILCGVNGAYCRDYRGMGETEHIMTVFYSGLEFVESLKVIEDHIFKISVCLPYTAKERLLPLLSENSSGRVAFLNTDPSFIDIINTGVSKGGAVRYLQQKYGISRNETMVFGDYYNDLDMLEQAELSYVMANAPADVQAHGNFLAPDNNERGVVSVIRYYLKHK